MPLVRSPRAQRGSFQTTIFDSEELSSLEKLGKLMTINHGLLVALGVSHPRLDRIRELVDHEGIGWTKLTGAGGGGCAITLLKPDITEERMRRLEKTLADEGYGKFETTLGCDGVGVLWPAVLKNGSGEDDLGGDEIDQDKFLNADGIEGVEELVGVHGESGDREALEVLEGRRLIAGNGGIVKNWQLDWYCFHKGISIVLL